MFEEPAEPVSRPGTVGGSVNYLDSWTVERELIGAL